MAQKGDLLEQYDLNPREVEILKRWEWFKDRAAEELRIAHRDAVRCNGPRCRGRRELAVVRREGDAAVLCLWCGYIHVSLRQRTAKTWLYSGVVAPSSLLGFDAASEFKVPPEYPKRDCIECGRPFAPNDLYETICDYCLVDLRERYPPKPPLIYAQQPIAHKRRGWELQNMQYHGGMFHRGEW